MDANSIPFIKYEGAGNDFIVLEGRHLDPSIDLSALSASVCDRRKGIGADGLLLLYRSTFADYQMRIFNADGSEPSMCGNGAYCLLDYIDRFITSFSHLSLQTKHAILLCRKMAGKIALNLGSVEVRHFPLHLDESTVCYVVNTGVPHAVVWVNDLDSIDMQIQGRKLRFDPRFGQDGVNVNFAKRTFDSIQVRTYERGVEAETLACGTGCAAVAFVAKQLYQFPSPIQISTRQDFFSKKIRYTPSLQFLLSGDGIEMIGAARIVFQGSISL